MILKDSFANFLWIASNVWFLIGLCVAIGYLRDRVKHRVVIVADILWAFLFFLLGPAFLVVGLFAYLGETKFWEKAIWKAR